MIISNFLKTIINNFIYSDFFLKFNLLLLLFFFIIILYSVFKEVITFFFTVFILKKKLVEKETKLINLRKKYLDGKINAKEYKINTMRILNSLN